MIRFLKSSAFKIFAVIAAALLAGSVFAVASRSGSSPLTSVTSIIFGPLSRLTSAGAAEFADIPVSFKSSSVLLRENEELKIISIRNSLKSKRNTAIIFLLKQPLSAEMRQTI